MTTIGSLFSGYGGLDMGVQLALGTMRTAWVSDIEPGPNKILAERFPDAPNLGDITTIDWDQVEPVDILAGGSPCQDLSTAGQRAGMRAGTRSGLWESMAKAIETIRPRLVVWENVLGATSATAFSLSDVEQDQGFMGNTPNGPNLRALGRVLGDLSNLGYDAQWTTIRASDVGAPHNRRRVFVVAYPDRSGLQGYGQSRQLAAEHAGPDSSIGVFPTVDKWGDSGPAIGRWERILGRSVPSPVEDGPDGHPRLSARFSEWMMGLPQGWVTDTDTTRAQQLRALGNGVVPQQAAYAITEIMNW